MAEWRSYRIAMIPGVDTVIEGVQSAASTLSSLLATLASLLRTLGDILVLPADALQAAMAALKAAIQGLVDQIYNLLQTNIYFYLDKGAIFSGAQPDGLQGFIGRWKVSFDDLGDRYRPQLAGTAQVSAMIFVVGANDLPSFRTMLSLLGSLFGRPDLVLDDEYFGLDVAARIEQGMSTPPDWAVRPLGDTLPPFAKLAENLKRVAGLVEVADSYAGLLSGLAEVAQSKADTLANLADELGSTIEAIQALLDTVGLYCLQVEGDSIENLISKVEDAVGIPGWNNNAWVSGVCLLAATADFGPVAELLGG